MEISDFSFNENALFLKIKEGIDMEMVMKDVIAEAQYEKEGRCYVSFKRRPVSDDYPDMRCSFVAFRRKSRPSCITKGTVVLDLWKDRRLAYLLVIEYGEYVVVLKRNIFTIKKLRKVVDNIDYNVLCKVFDEESTVYKRFGMSNLDMADFAMRSKSFVAENLESVFSTIGAKNYALNSFLLRNSDGDYSLSLDISKINQPGQKVNIMNLLMWSRGIIDRIARCDGGAISNYLSVFATPVEYLAEYNAGNLDAKAILFSLNKLGSEKWLEDITKEGEDGTLTVADVCRDFEYALNLKQSDEHSYYVEIDEEKRVDVIVSERGVSFSCNWMNCIMLNPKGGSDHETETLASYVRNTGAYIVMFNSPQLKYANRKLFKDLGLVANVDVFLDLFEEDEELTRITSEKGVIRRESTGFVNGSLFRYIEDHYQKNEMIMVCDDLGTEWADHILIGEKSVTLFAAKHKDRCFSATAFQEVVGQAQKNLGIFYPLDSMWESKIRKWNEPYRLDHVESTITRVRTEGKSSADAVEMWKKAEKQVNYQKDLYIVIDFMEKHKLEDSLRKLQRDEDFGEKKEAIPILWLISSLWLSCQDMHVGLHITCRP